MRRHERQISDEKAIEEILTKATVCRVAFQGEEYPYVVPMNYGYKDGALYFHCATEGQKLDLIRKDAKVAFEITDYQELVAGDKSCEWTTFYRSVFGKGEIEIVDDFTQKLQGLDVIMHQHGKLKNAYDPNLLERINILKLNIKAMTAKANGLKR